MAKVSEGPSRACAPLPLALHQRLTVRRACRHDIASSRRNEDESVAAGADFANLLWNPSPNVAPVAAKGKPMVPLPMKKCNPNETMTLPPGFTPTSNGGPKGDKRGRVAHFLAAPAAKAAPRGGGKGAAQDPNSFAAELARIGYGPEDMAKGAPGQDQGAPNSQLHDLQAVHEQLAVPDDVMGLFGAVAPPELSKRDVIELKSLRQPHPMLHRVLQCIAVLLDYPDTSWMSFREMVRRPRWWP